MESLDQQIGKRLRAQRLRCGLTLDQLAAESGFTKSYLSKIENAKKIPPIGSLAQICRALHTDLAFLFAAPEQDEGSVEDGVSVVRAQERRPAVRGGTSFGYDYESLAPRFDHKHMEPFLFTFPTSMSEEIYFQHEGEEFIFVIAGRVRFLIEGREWLLEPGDSIYFDSGRPHRGEAVGGEAKALVVITYLSGAAEAHAPNEARGSGKQRRAARHVGPAAWPSAVTTRHSHSRKA